MIAWIKLEFEHVPYGKQGRTKAVLKGGAIRRRDDLVNAGPVHIPHPSGSYNRHAPWSIPKGVPNKGETHLEATARRETREETAVTAGPLVPLGSMVYKKSRKQVHAFGGPAPADAAGVVGGRSGPLRPAGGSVRLAPPQTRPSSSTAYLNTSIRANHRDT